jgi:hypothetical protein
MSAKCTAPTLAGAFALFIISVLVADGFSQLAPAKTAPCFRVCSQCLQGAFSPCLKALSAYKLA